MEGAVFDESGGDMESPDRLVCLRLASLATLNRLLDGANENECPSAVTLSSGQTLICYSQVERRQDGAPDFKYQCALQKVVCIQPAYIPRLDNPQ